MIKAIVVDDELRQLQGLRLMFQSYAAMLDVVALCSDPEEAIRKIKDLKPDLVFVNVRMPGKNAFELLDAIGTINFEVVFTTGHFSAGEQAARYKPLGYLYKPYDESELAELLDLNRLPERLKTLLRTAT